MGGVMWVRGDVGGRMEVGCGRRQYDIFFISAVSILKLEA